MKLDSQNLNLKYDSYKFNILEKNQLFSEAKIYVMYHGENRNNSSISKESVDEAIQSIYNIPIVGEFVEDENSEEENNFGGHGGKLVVDDNGARFIHTTKPMGVIPESANVYWETIKDSKEREREYLVVEGALLWNRYEDAVNTLKSDNFGQSMEIEVEEGTFDDDTGLYMIEKFDFSAFCVLGLDGRKDGGVEPAFEDSKIITYSKEFSNELKEMKKELSEYFTSFSKEEEEVKKMSKEKEFDLESAKTAVKKAEDTKIQEDIDKAREIVSELEDGEEKDKLVARLDDIEVEEETEEDDFSSKKEDENEEESETVQTETTGIAGVVSEEKDETEEDKQAGAGEVKEGTVEGDARAIADENTETDYAEKYKSLKEDFGKLQEELELLREYKLEVEKEEHGKQAIELFDKLGLEEKDIEALDIYAYTIEELEDKCYSILGRKLAGKEDNFSLQDDIVKTNKVGLSQASTENKKSKYGSLFTKYSDK